MRKSARGAANLQCFNTERQQQNISRIQSQLKAVQRQRLEFKSLGRLAEYLSELTGIHRTTLARNDEYKLLLLNFLAKRPGYREAISESNATPEMLQAKLLGLKLENANFKKRVERLERAVQAASVPNAIEAEISDSRQGDFYLAFIDTAMALTAVLERIQDTVSVDMQKRTIEDLAAPPSRRLIVGPERTASYIRWLTEGQNRGKQFQAGG
ncbi:MAG: hypothetical protein ING69_02610 [Rhodocyclaceae bacterium]|nr:hypothetical protein [Rhodocyclaceae bacterium]